MFDIILTGVIFHTLSALALFVVFTLSASASARKQAATAASTRLQDYSPSYSHS
jgi:hypothetical protein